MAGPDGTEGAAPAWAEAAREVGLRPRAAVAAGEVDAVARERFQAWLEAGRHGGMDWLARDAERALDPRRWKPWARTVLAFSLPYHRAGGGFRGGGRVARYALGRDYHHVLRRRLERLGRALRAAGAVTRFRAVVDAAPVLEREWALRAGLGFRGKNTLVLEPSEGPWVLLGELLVDAEWETWPPQPPTLPDCGRCTRCLEACPTDAFPAPWVLDARRCISYLTIEHRGFLPRALRPRMGDWVFGCDVCLEVCPFGRFADDHAEEWGTHEGLELTLQELLTLSEPVFHRVFRGSPLRRTGWAGLLRNACVALGNLGRGTDALRGALGHPEPLVRGHAAWALGRLGVLEGLAGLAAHDPSPEVREEAAHALESVGD